MSDSGPKSETADALSTEVIESSIAELLQIVANLRACYPRKTFTLDGRLVGDLGEMLAERNYQLEVFQGLRRQHDAQATDGTGRMVQIKATMKDSLTFPADHVPECYLGIRIRPDGSVEEIFNGPGAVASQAIAARQHPKTNLHSISIRTLQALSATVPDDERIPPRS